MITLEKILLLKTIPLFNQTPDDLLLQIASSIVKEQPMKAEELLIEKGSNSTTMYVIVNGSVKVHNENKTIAEIGEREIFGELAALSLEPRTASVTALTDGLLLKISSLDLYELMNIDVSFTKGIIHSLCTRARTMSLQIDSLMD